MYLAHEIQQPIENLTGKTNIPTPPIIFYDAKNTCVIGNLLYGFNYDKQFYGFDNTISLLLLLAKPKFSRFFWTIK